MAYETWPKRPGQGKAGSISGWPNGNGTSYPDKAANTRDDTGTVKQGTVKHEAKAGGSAQVSCYYPKSPAHKKFGNLEGI